MADEKKPGDKPGDKPASAPAPLGTFWSHPDPFVQFVWTILALVVILSLLNSFTSLFQDIGDFLSFGSSGQDVKTILLSDAPSLIGGSVVTSKSTPVYREPGVDQFKTEPVGAKATILDGPVIKDGVKYWHVQFEDGTIGWVPEDNLNYLNTTKEPLATAKDVKVGDVVSSSRDGTAVFSEPGVNQIDSVPKDTKGEIIAGPETRDGVKYWKIKFSNGVVGWVKEADLDRLVTKPVPLSSMPSIIGGRVIALGETVVYDSPGGKEIGRESKDAAGVIIEGPVIKDGVKYWHIKFNDGTDGWVKEGDLKYVVGSENSFSNRLSRFFKNLFFYGRYVAGFISLILLAAAVYLYRKIVNLKKLEKDRMYIKDEAPSAPKNSTWERVLTNLAGPGENDWKLAVIEAEIMLNDLLTDLGMPGDSVGDQLKAVDRADFKTIDNAWDAHRVRNSVAHGDSFVLSNHEAKRVIELYRTVFEEFKRI